MVKFVNATSPLSRLKSYTILVPLDRGMFVVVIRVQLYVCAARWRQCTMLNLKMR